MLWLTHSSESQQQQPVKAEIDSFVFTMGGGLHHNPATHDFLISHPAQPGEIK